MTNSKSFTLIELLVAIAIIGLLASIVLVSLQAAAASARDGKRDAEVGEANSVLRKTLEVYYDTNGNYPWNDATEDEDGCCLEKNVDIKNKLDPYLSAPLEDPLYSLAEPDSLDKHCYRYKTVNHGEDYKIRVNYETGGYKETASWGGGGIVYWTCGDDVTFTYRGSSVTYGSIYNSATAECWLDRNLGASRQATAYNDSAAYGDFFQWGRLDDNHQDPTSGTTATNSSADNPGHSNFILELNIPKDWRDPQNDNLWQGVSGINNPCPDGWRLPTLTEWDTERSSWSSNDQNGSYAGLKITIPGFRFYGNGNISSAGSMAIYWSSTLSGATVRLLYFDSSSWTTADDYRASGFSVRCIKD